MKLRRLELDQFKKFERAVCIEGVADGLNLVAGPNELGKSTLLEALRAVLFEKHRSGAQAIRELQHHRHKTAPWVALEFELEGARYRIEKRFLQRPFARLTLPDGRRLEGDPAEEKLQELLGRAQPMRAGGEVASVWQVLLVGQGSSLTQAEVGGPARRTLEASLQAELGSLTGAQSGHALCRAIEEQLYQLIDRRGGRPKGHYRQIGDELGAAVRALADLDRRKADLEQDLERLERARALHRQLRADESASAAPAEVAAALQHRDELMRLCAETREAEAALELARRDLDAAEAEVARREALAIELARAERAGADGEAVGAETRRALGEAEVRRHAAKAELARLESLRADAERRVRVLDELARTRREDEQLLAALDDVAAEVRLEIAPDAVERVRLGGAPLDAAAQVARVTDPLEIEIGGVGRIMVRPASGRRERLLRRRHEVAGRLADLARQLDEAPRDAIALQAALAEAEGDLDESMRAGRRARAEHDDALAAWHRANVAAEHAAARLEEMRARETALRQALALVRESADETRLAAAVHASRERLGAAAAGLQRLRAQADGDSLEAVERRVAVLRGTIEERGRRLQDLELNLERLTARIELQQGAGLDEQIATARRRMEQLERQREAYRREAAVLGLLRDVLRDAELDMKDHWLAPVVGRVRPYLQVLFPGAEVALDEHFHITAITREPAGAEGFDQLSHGTREQIAVLTRLAFAELLADQGMPAVVVLDDALAFSDDQRLTRMFEVLERAALRVQILVFTCRERAFAGLRAARPQLSAIDPGHRDPTSLALSA